MSKMAHTDDIDELVSSVRDFVSHKEPHRTRSRILRERLILTPEQRVTDEPTHETPVFIDPNSDLVQGNVHVLNAAKGLDKIGLEATIAELEAAVTAQSDDWEPDEGEDFADAAWAASAFRTPNDDSLAQAEMAPDAVTANEAQGTASSGRFPVKDAFAAKGKPAEPKEQASAPTPLVGIDEDMLRGMVVKIMHEELSGALGERITRNVRKLVRREINRVLTSREMGQD
ncbi:hypothetical protein MWU60_07450 [Yoonia sp. F2084L]|uniref:hypothetical protein n=1 Tax=Yoonia sp. F2084L TaxID=2926419 RepID=UPI001FF48EB3|nr:hypothetical protein [Yoonia sp. F2084L]MCK0095403.1 hypothetical protein [Yoonia sp. F2084L]